MTSYQLLTKSRIRLGSGGANRMLEPLRLYGHETILTDLSRPATVQARLLLQSVDIVLMDVTQASRAILATVHDLAAAIGICDVAPRLLCFSTAHRNPQFVLDVERCGARYVRVADLPMLVDAIDVVLAGIEGLRRNGPYFEVRHRFSRGCCAPGELVEAWYYPRATQDPQLHLGASVSDLSLIFLWTIVASL